MRKVSAAIKIAKQIYITLATWFILFSENPMEIFEPSLPPIKTATTKIMAIFQSIAVCTRWPANPVNPVNPTMREEVATATRDGIPNNNIIAATFNAPPEMPKIEAKYPVLKVTAIINTTGIL